MYCNSPGSGGTMTVSDGVLGEPASPKARADAPGAANQRTPRECAFTEPATNEASRILLVEDNEMNRDMLSRRLSRKGYSVTVAVDGAQGVEMAVDTRPDLILMDMSLPVMDGWEAARQLKANPESSGIPIIALTAHAMSDDRNKAIEAGCDEYDTKPVEFSRLLQKMESLLRRPAVPEDREIRKDPENRTIAKDPEDRTIAKDPEDRTIAKDPEDRERKDPEERAVAKGRE